MHYQEEENKILDKIKLLSPWFHNVHLKNGIQTAPDHPLGDFPAFKWKSFEHLLPKDMSSLKVLDIGCNAGFYSLECAKRGAAVTAIDIDKHYLRQASWLAGYFNLEQKIDFHHLQVYDLVKKDWQFDIVFFLGVFYHLRYPLLALDIITKKAKKMLIFQSLMLDQVKETKQLTDFDFNNRNIMQDRDWPSMAFIENKFQNDPTNWWVPNPSAIKAMFRTAGFNCTHNPAHEIYIFERDANLPPVTEDWNMSEYLSATGSSWKKEVQRKTGNKGAGDLET